MDRSLNLPPGGTLGIDVSRGSWAAVYLCAGTWSAGLFPSLSEAVLQFPAAAVSLVDIPLGLPQGQDDLRPEPEARRMLGRRASTLFNVPCRQALSAPDYPAARRINREVLGKSLSAQSYGITKAVREADTFLLDHPQWKNRLLESHPELCFAVLNGGIALVEKKSSPEGILRRLELLQGYLPEAPLILDGYLERFPRPEKSDDLLDALVLALMGREITACGMKSIPKHPRADARGILMQIVYARCP
jgi:predicted RNase H-like nuclease